MSFEPRDYLRHILGEADYLIRTSEDLTLDGFLTDETLPRAFVRSLEVIGEAANQVPGEFQVEYSVPQVRSQVLAILEAE